MESENLDLFLHKEVIIKFNDERVEKGRLYSDDEINKTGEKDIYCLAKYADSIHFSYFNKNEIKEIKEDK